MEQTLYITDNAGHLRYWTCREVLDGLEIEHGVVGGQPQFQTEDIECGKGGRDQDEQIHSRISSRVNKQLQKGYVFDIEVAKARKAVNVLGFKKPMLAKKQEDVDMNRMMTKPFYLQYKLDGNRCIANQGEEKLTPYTRNGKEFTTLEHIMDELDELLPAGIAVDGELYIHGVPLQSIVSYVKRKQIKTKDVEYHIYDMISNEPFSIRFNRLETILRDLNEKASINIKLVKTTAYAPNSSVDLGAKLREARELGYEGLMFRSDYSLVRGQFKMVGYEDGKRSGSLIKLKAWESEEFFIHDIQPSSDGWAILHCHTDEGKEFTVSCPGEINFRHYVMNNKTKYIGRQCTVQFAYWTKDNMPFHPVAVAIRDYE